MVLSNELISQFVKTTRDDTTAKKESIVYGTTVEYEGQIYVRFDGSDLLTPVFSTTKVAAGERVTVMIKNHAATITGSTSSPSANNNDVANIEKNMSDLSDRVLTVEQLVADDATINNLTAIKADIETLKSKNVTIEENLSSNTADIGTLKSTNVTVTETLSANSADIVTLQTQTATITENLNANTADIDDLRTNNATITETLTANSADIGTLKAGNATITENLNANSAAIVELQAKNVTVDETLTANRADIDTLTANNAVIEENLIANNAEIITLKTNKLDAETAKITYANIDFSNIGKAAMEYLYSQSGLIKDVVVGDATITGKLVGVTISGDLVEANTIVADKLVIQGSDGLYYKLNTDGIKTEAEQTDYNSLNGQVIMAQSITASKIAVDDLVAFDATIGGFNITDHSLYSGVKETVDNTTRGVYLDSDGQMALGDGSRFIKYYKTADGSYKLEILADDITLSSEDQSVAIALANVSEATRTNSEDLAAYISSNNAELENLQTQIDGSITTWFYEYAPTNENAPASEWPTTDLKNNHLGDLFYDTITGYCYRWQVQNNVYSWNRITDVDVTKALADAHTAQDTADAKRRVFVTTPTPPYDVGDLWTQGSTGDLMRCQTAKTSGQSYAAADWIKASKYTDDTAANAAQNGVNALQVRMTTAETNISQNAEAIELRATKTELSKTLEGYYTKAQSDSNLTVKADEITSSVAITYATKSALATTNSNVTTAQSTANSAVNKADAAQEDIDALSASVSTNYATKSELTQTSESITSSVSSTYATKSALATTNNNVTAAQNAADAAQADVDALSNSVSTNYATKSELTQTSNSITSSVSSTYATKSALASTDAKVATAQSTADAAKKNLYHSADGTTAAVGYVGFADLTINNTYMNRPIQISLENRGRNGSDIEVRFKNANTKDPDLQTLRENGDINVWIVKLETSKWRLIAQKSEGYDTIYVVDYTNNNASVAVEWVDVHYDTLPTENITASTKLIGSAVASTIATKTEITQLSDRITANVTETTNLGTRMSTVEQTADGLTARLTTAESDIDTAQNTANTAKTNAATAQSTADTAKTNAATAQTTANNAAKTATNYLSYSSSGLVVGDMTASTLGKNVLIDSDSVDIRNGSTVLASFGEDHVTLGRNAEESYIDLCDGAGRISANTAEAATSYPYRNAILIDSQEIETESTRFVATVSNAYGLETAPTLKKRAELYMLRDSSDAGSVARLESEHWNTSTGRYNGAGFVGLTYDDTNATYASVYVNDSFNSVYNSVKVYKTKTVMNKPVFINGTEFTGDNKILWSGAWYMSSGHTATLSEAVTDQANGIVLVFSRYSSSTAQNYHFQTFFIPKSQVSNHPGTGHCFMLTSDGTFSLMASKYLYINDTSIAGHANNSTTGSGTSGITYTNNGYVLRYVVGV